MSSQKLKRTTGRGFVNNIILESLLDSDKYGYEIIKEVEEKSEGKIVLKQPSLYSALKRFESRGIISSYWGDSDIGGRRHYYSLTEVGKNYYESLMNGEKVELPKIIDTSSESVDVKEANITINELIEETENKNIVVEQEVVLEPNASAEITSAKNDVADIKEVPEVQSAEEPEEYDLFKVIETKSNVAVDPVETTIDLKDKKPTEEIEVVSVEESLVESTELDKEDSIEEVSEQVENVIQDNLFDSPTLPVLSKEEEIDVEIINEIKKDDLQVKDDVAEEDKEDKKDIPLISEKDHEFFNWEEIKRAAYIKQLEEKLFSGDETSTTEKVVKKAVVDEFGITRDSSDILPRRKEKVIDNVGARIEVSDPILNTKNIKKHKNESSQEVEPTVSIYSGNKVKSFEVSDKFIEEKIESHKKNKNKNKLDDIDYESLLGDIYISDDESKIEVFEKSYIAEEIEDIKHAQSYSKNANIKVTSYTALEENLKNDGFKYKPYNSKVDADDKRYEFIYINKAKSFLALIMLVLTSLQLGAFLIAVNQIQYVIKPIDKTVIYILFAIPSLIFLIMLSKFIVARKKRKKVSFHFGTNFIYSILAFLSLSIIVYAVNSFMGLHLQNIEPYYITLFMPIILFFNIVLTPMVYLVIINNKKFY